MAKIDGLEAPEQIEIKSHLDAKAMSPSQRQESFSKFENLARYVIQLRNLSNRGILLSMRCLFLAVLIVGGCSDANKPVEIPVKPVVDVLAEQPALVGKPSKDLVEFCGLSQDRDVAKIECHDKTVTDFSSLAALTAMKDLSLHYTQITDLTPLSGLAALEILNFDNGQVSDLTPLAGLTALKFLHFDSNPVSDLAPLADLTKLEILALDNSQAKDLAPLARLTALSYLTLARTQVTDLTPLGGLEALQILDLRSPTSRLWLAQRR